MMKIYQSIKEKGDLKNRYLILFIFMFLLSTLSLKSLYAGDEYGYIGDQVVKEIYEVYDDMETLRDEYLPVSEWENPALEKSCLKSLTASYTDEKNAPAKVKVLKVYLNYPSWKPYTKVSSDASNGAPTFRKTYCIYVLQKDSDKFMIVWPKQVTEDCTNYNRTNLKPISYGETRVTPLTAAEWEDWGRVTAFKLTKEQVTGMGLLSGKSKKITANKNLSVDLEYTPGVKSKAKIQAKNESSYLVLWEGGDYSSLKNEEFKNSQNSIPSADKLKVGAKVSAQWTNGQYYPGKIIKIKGNAYSIQWDDGSDVIDVTIDQIRLSK